MIDRRRFLFAAAGSTALAAARPLDAAAPPESSRIALVIGNDRYRQSPLGNAVNDARAMAALLEGAGFRVDLLADADGASLAAGVKRYGEAIARPEVGLAVFYYAGHGVQVDWRNYLLPVDASISEPAELRSQCLDLGQVVTAMSRAQGKDYVILLDACRDNPLGGAWRPEQKGLSQFDAPARSLIAFATAPGKTASDGGGSHGLYTENLVRELGVKGASIEDALKRVRLNVRLASKGAQVPWESTSLEADVYIHPQAPARADRDAEFAAELAGWERARASQGVEELAGYLRAHPNGRFSEIAQARLEARLAAREPVRARIEAPAGALVVDSRHPLPRDHAKSANPYSAGTWTLDRHFSVGDEATWRQLDRHGEPKGEVTMRVTRVDPDGDRVEYNDGVFVTDLLGNPLKTPKVEYDAPVQLNPAELQVGRRWSARYHARKRLAEGDLDMEFRIVRRELVRVPAGEFDAYRIEGSGHFVSEAFARMRLFKRHLAGSPGLAVEMVVWQVPGLNFVVKSEQVAERGQRKPQVERLELVSLRQARA